MAHCIEIAGVVSVATVATSSMALCTAANALQGISRLCTGKRREAVVDSRAIRRSAATRSRNSLLSVETIESMSRGTTPTSQGVICRNLSFASERSPSAKSSKSPLVRDQERLAAKIQSLPEERDSSNFEGFGEEEVAGGRVKTLKELQEAHDKHYARVQVLEKDNSRLLQQMDALNDKHRQLSTKHRELEKLAAGKTSETSAPMVDLQRRATIAESRVAELEAQLAAADQAIKLSEIKAAHVDTARATTKQLETLLSMERKKTADVDSMIRSKDKVVSDLRQTLQTKDQVLARMKAENADLQRMKGEFSDKERLLAQLRDDRDSLVQENSSLRSAYEELKAAYESSAQNSAAAPSSPSSWKDINEQTKRIEEERASAWEEFGLARQKTDDRQSGTTTGVPSVSKPPSLSGGSIARSDFSSSTTAGPSARSGLSSSTAEGQQNGNERAPYISSMSKLSFLLESKDNTPSRFSETLGKPAGISDGVASRLLMPSSSDAAVNGRPTSSASETLRATTGTNFGLKSRLL